MVFAVFFRFRGDFLFCLDFEEFFIVFFIIFRSFRFSFVNRAFCFFMIWVCFSSFWFWF